MAGSLNKVILIGNLGRDPEIRTMNNGKRMASFSIATGERWKDRDGQTQERTEWHRIAVFSEGLISVIEQYVRRGSKLYIEGEMQTRKWTDQASGQERYTTEVVLRGFNSRLVMLDSRRASADASEPGTFSSSAPAPQSQNFSKTPPPPQNADLDDDIPF